MSNGALRVLLGDPGVEHHLQQHVAELLGHVRPVAGLDRLDRLVRLLDEVRHQRLVRLLGVPRAAARASAAGPSRRPGRAAGSRARRRTPTSISTSGGSSRPADLGGQGVGEAGVAVGGPDPDDVGLARPRSSRRRASSAGGDVAERGRGDAGVLDGQQLRLVGVAAEHLAGLLERWPTPRARAARARSGEWTAAGSAGRPLLLRGPGCRGTRGRGGRGGAGVSQFGAGGLSCQLLAVERAVAGVDRDLGLADLGQDGRAGLLARGRFAARLVWTKLEGRRRRVLDLLDRGAGLGLGDALAVLLPPGR